LNFDNYIKHHTQEINETLNSVLPAEDIPPATIHRAMRYSIFNGGKRLRPLIMIASSDYMGIPVNNIIYHIAAMIEMVHAYSLVHDDLPSMDNDNFRRGKPSVHKMFNEAIAVLTGDALLTEAFLVMGKLQLYKKNGDISRLLTEFASAIGSKGLVGGQVADLEKKNTDITENDIKFIHKNKTASLIIFSTIAPALFFKKQSYITSMYNYGDALGMAFQIGDDIADQKKNRNEASAVDVFGLDGAKDLFHEYMDKAKKSVKYKKEGVYLFGICDWITRGFNL